VESSRPCQSPRLRSRSQPCLHAAMSASSTTQPQQPASLLDVDIGMTAGHMVSGALLAESDGEDLAMLCSTCGAPTVKVSSRMPARSDEVLEMNPIDSARELSCFQCSCRSVQHAGREQEQSIPAHRLVVIIKRYIRCILPAAQPTPSTARSSWSSTHTTHTAAASVSSTRAALPLSQSLLQVPVLNHGEVNSARCMRSITSTTTPRHLPLRVLLPSSRD
jgi:hypothetical protein